MKSRNQIVISASRRTDIPAFYMDWFMQRLETGFFETVNPFNQKVSIVPATPDKVHTIVFWSKNFGPFIKGPYIDILIGKGYHLFFNFTVNSECLQLEPHVPPLSERLNQLESLCRNINPESVTWRFDPICFFRTSTGTIEHNLHQFKTIADRAAPCGIRRCITSFMDIYPKIQKRTASMDGFEWIDPAPDRKLQILTDMEAYLTGKGIRLYTCCENEIMGHLPAYSTIRKSACIPNDLLVKLYGGRLSLKRDTGQRAKQGCGCMVSSDIGSYRHHPCPNACLYCYANPISTHKKAETGYDDTTA